MLHPHDGLLELAVHHHAVGYNDDVVKNDLVVRIVQRTQTMRQPCNGVGFARTGAVLNQIVLRGTVYPDIREKFADHIQLVVARENEIFRPFHLAGLVIDLFLYLNKNELADQVQDGILRQNILPHIGHAVFVRKGRISRTSGYPLAVAHIEGQEKGGIPGQFGGHIDLFQIHGEVDKAAGLEEKQTGLGIALGAVLVNGVLIGLSSGVALELKGDDGKAVQEYYHINALFVAGPDLLHDREDILAVFLRQIRVEGGGGLGVHQLQLLVGNLNAVLQHINQAAAGFGGFRVDKADDGIFQVILIDFSQVVHGVRLGAVQKLKQHFPVHGEGAVKMSSLANDIAVVFFQAL